MRDYIEMIAMAFAFVLLCLFMAILLIAVAAGPIIAIIWAISYFLL